MKLAALKDFYYRNEVRGCMVALKKGDTFELDTTKDAEQIFSLIGNRCAVPTEEKFIPERSRYIVLSQIPYEADGMTKQGRSGEIVILTREAAIPLLISAHIKPVDISAWHPSELIRPKNIDVTGEVKKMFDDLPTEKLDNWATRGVIRK